MNLKRATLIALAACLLPGAAFAQTSHSFKVTATSSDASAAGDMVTVGFSCNDGDINSSSQQIAIGDASGFTFVITNHQATADCEITQSGMGGYTASPTKYTETDVPVDDAVVDRPFDYTPVNGTFSTTVTWDTSGGDASVVDLTYTLQIECDVDLVSASPGSPVIDKGTATWTGLTTDVTGTVTVDNSNGDVDCTGRQLGVEDSTVDTESTCPATPSLTVVAGGSNSCSISNTLFFEGIPTLSQYGMAIMALLMLGVGFVGFRRFV